MANSTTEATATAGLTTSAQPLFSISSRTTTNPVCRGHNDALVPDEVLGDDNSVAQKSLASSTTSVTSSILEHRMENGRTYHTYNDGEYSMPNDERENNRLDLQHNLFIRSFDDRLGTAPPNNTGAKVGRVLNIGTGSGIWAIDFGDEHPESEVIGVDLSAVQAGLVPPNVTFEVDDIEEPWAFSNGFEYIHSRMMTGSISDWDKYLQRCYDNLNPGGYLELNDIDAVPLSDDGTLTEDTNLMKSVRLWHEGFAGLGRHFLEFSRFKDALAKVGFEDVHIKRYRWPTNGWPKNKKYKELGIWNLENIAPHWDGFIMAPLTRALGWTKEDVLALGMDARRDFADRSIHAYFNIWSIYGRKPSA